MSWFVYVVTLDPASDRDRVIERLQARGIPSRGYFPPVHAQPYMRELCPDAEVELPVTSRVARSTVALPFHPLLRETEVDHVVESLRSAIDEAGTV